MDKYSRTSSMYGIETEYYLFSLKYLNPNIIFPIMNDGEVSA